MHAAIAFASEDRISRAPSRSASRSGRSSSTSSVASSAYGSSTSLLDERTGVEYCFGHKAPPKYHEVMLTEGAPAELLEAKGTQKLSLLWNAVEAAERRKDAQVARHLVLALPDSDEVSLEDRIELTRTFAEKYFVSEGLGVQLDIHAPEIDAEGNESNWHAHLLITTRRFLRDLQRPEQYFEDKKARDQDPLVRSGKGYRFVAEGTLWGEEWRAHQERFFRQRGYKTRVDLNGLIAQNHVGTKRTWARRASSELSELQERIEASWQAAHKPEDVLKALTRYDATFTENDLDRFLKKQLLGEEPGEIASVRAAVMERALALRDPDTGKAVGLFTSQEVRDQERAAMAAAAELAGRRGDPVSPGSARAATKGRSLREDQAGSVEYAIEPGDLKLIEGRAGTGKSYALWSIRKAHELDGKRVIGVAPTNAVAGDMKTDGFRESGTIHSALFKLNIGFDEWDENTVIIADEAAMMGAELTGELLEHARAAKAKLILVGDDRQLASIERGGLFSQMLRQAREAGHPPAEITEVVRQDEDWQRQAARDLAQYRFAKALTAFDVGGAITWTEEQDQARAALVEAWAGDAKTHKDDSQFVFAYTNRDVDVLNRELRQVRRTRNELIGQDVEFWTVRGSEEFGLEERLDRFAIKDRVQFTKTDKSLNLYNGNVGTIENIDPETREITVKIDGPEGEPARMVTWNGDTFQGFKHGYAGTIYKGQGKTLDRTYLYHTDHWQAASGYVALTRQRKNAQVFVARETAPTLDKLARQMEQSDLRCASLEWATEDDLAPGVARAPAPEARPDVAAGRAQFEERRARLKAGKTRFQESAAVHRQDRQMATARDWVRDWYRLARDFYQALPGMDREPAYGQARTQLLAHARLLGDEQPELRRMLTEQPELTAPPSDQASELGQKALQALQLALGTPQPAQAITGMVEYLENDQRAELREQQRKADIEARDQTQRQRNPIDTRG